MAFVVKVPCGECKKQFNNTWFLHQHELRTHSGEKRKLLCPRDGCKKQFTCRFNLESHLLGDHEEKKPFSCVFAGCKKSFAMKVNFFHFFQHLTVKTRNKQCDILLQQEANGIFCHSKQQNIRMN